MRVEVLLCEFLLSSLSLSYIFYYSMNSDHFYMTCKRSIWDSIIRRADRDRDKWAIYVINSSLVKKKREYFHLHSVVETLVNGMHTPLLFCLTEMTISIATCNTRAVMMEMMQITYKDALKSFWEKLFITVHGQFFQPGWTMMQISLVWICKKETISFYFSTNDSLLRANFGAECSAIIPAGREGSGIWKTVLKESSVLLLHLWPLFFMDLWNIISSL